MFGFFKSIKKLPLKYLCVTYCNELILQIELLSYVLMFLLYSLCPWGMQTFALIHTNGFFPSQSNFRFSHSRGPEIVIASANREMERKRGLSDTLAYCSYQRSSAEWTFLWWTNCSFPDVMETHEEKPIIYTMENKPIVTCECRLSRLLLARQL